MCIRDSYYAAFDDMLKATNNSFAPWHLISGMDQYTRTLEVYQTVLSCINTAVAKKHEPEEEVSPVIFPGGFPLLNMPRLHDVDLTKTISDEEYDRELKKCQKRLRELHNTAVIQLSRSVSRSMTSIGWPVISASSLFIRPRINRM